MGMTAYVGQGKVKILAKNLNELHLRLEEAAGDDAKDIETLSAEFGMELSFDRSGNIVDVYPTSSSWSEDYEGKFYQMIAPFVEDGSYQTFYCDGYLFAYVYRGGTVEEIDLDALAKQLAEKPMLTCSNPKCGSRMTEDKLEYRWPDPKVVALVSPGDTVPQGICPHCGSAVYQNETEE